jgi:hypothetical protein
MKDSSLVDGHVAMIDIFKIIKPKYDYYYVCGQDFSTCPYF